MVGCRQDVSRWWGAGRMSAGGGVQAGCQQVVGIRRVSQQVAGSVGISVSRANYSPFLKLEF